MTKIELKELLKKHEEVIKTSLLIRKIEEKLLHLFSESKLNGTVHTCVGQELIGVAVIKALEENDFIISNHRGHGHYIAKSNDIKGLIAELMGRETGVCRGIGGSQHLFSHKFISNGIQGGMLPITAGIALSYQINKSDNICVVFIGDGTIGEGVVYETLNICGLWKLPILIILENNRYAQSTCMEQTFCGSLQKRIEGFGLAFKKTNTWNLNQLELAITDAVDNVRHQKIPCFLEIETYRLNPHSKGDDNRHSEEILFFQEKDLLNQIINCGLKEIENLLSEIHAEIDDAVTCALKSPLCTFYKDTEPISSDTLWEEVAIDTDEKRINH